MKFHYQQSGLTKDNFKKYSKKLSVYLKYLNDVANKNTYDYAESSINCPFDRTIDKKISAIVKEKTNNKLKYIVVIGIGGSNLGTKAVYDALYGYFDILTEKRFPKIIFLDTTNPHFLVKFKELIDNTKRKEEFLLNAISKSGSTTETLANLEIAIGFLTKKFKNSLDRLVLTTDYQSPLWLAGQKKQISTLAIPQKVGGRFSIFSAVGLFPLALAGINTNELLKGAQIMRKKCISKDAEKNPAVLSAIAIFHNYKKGYKINDNFFFNPELESLGKWYRQLMGESIGKEKNIFNKTVHIGITPTVSIGSTDLHSVGQLYLGGPKDKYTNFIWIKQASEIAVPKKRIFPKLIEQITAKTAKTILNAILRGVKIAYTKQNLPFSETTLEENSEKHIGEYMQFKMMEIMFLANLLKINAFDQPNVENYKKETKKILNS